MASRGLERSGVLPALIASIVAWSTPWLSELRDCAPQGYFAPQKRHTVSTAICRSRLEILNEAKALPMFCEAVKRVGLRI